MRNLLPCIIVLTAVSLVGCGDGGWQVGGPPVHPDVLKKADLRYYWTLPVRLDNGESIRQLYRLDENLYLLTNTNRLLAIDARTGAIRPWSVTVAPFGVKVFRPVHVDNVLLAEKVSGIPEMLGSTQPAVGKARNLLMINSPDHVLVIDRADGKIIRDIQFDFAASTGGATDGVYYYVGSVSGKYYAYRLPEATVAWARSTDDLLSAPLEYFNGRLFIGGGDCRFYATLVNSLTPAAAWSQKLDGPVTTEFEVDQRACFVPSEDNHLYAYEPFRGANLWTFTCMGPLRTPVQVGENTAFQYAQGDKFYAINIAKGDQRWAMPNGRRALAVMGGAAYVLDNQNRMSVVDEITGEVKTVIPMTGMQLFLANVTAPAIYTANQNGTVFCIRPISAGYLTPAMLAPKK